MKKRIVYKFLALFVCLLLSTPFISARTSENNTLRCGVPDKTPVEAARIEADFQARATKKSPRDKNIRTETVINVYMHIITDSNGNGQLSDDIITAQYDVLNAAFASAGFSFVEAERDVTINDEWFNMGYGDENTEYAAKRALRRGTGEDLNFYTAGLSDGLLGWATFPNSYDAVYGFRDGVVCAFATLPGAGSGAYSEGDTGTHEVGHWMGLYHTFQGGCSETGDYVADTPQVAEPNFGCPGDVDSCPNDGQGNDQTWNFMDYVNDACMDNFTTGQNSRMQQWWELYRVGSGCFINCDGHNTAPTQSHYRIQEMNSGASHFGGDYSGLSSLVLGDDSVTALSLPFAYPFFNDTFNYVYLSSNGLMSFYYSNVFSGVNVMNKKGPNSRKDEVDGSVLNDGIFIVVLHRDLKKDNVRNVADRIRSHHSDKNAVGFHAQVQKVHDHLRMLTIRDPSDEALQFLSSHQDVASVEPNRRYSIVGNLRTELPEGPLTSNPYSWGLDRIDQENLPLDQATYNPPVDTNAGAGVDVYVADTGLDTTHAEFANTNVRSVANLYNGFGDVTENTDGHGHGTHCAGTVGGINVGVAPSANIYGLKVLSDGGSGSTSIIVEGLDMVMARRLADPAKPMVVSMSLGGGCSNCPTNPMNLAVDELSVANVTVVVAAGNSAADACVLAPASASSAVTVGSTTRDDELSSFSSVGSCVDILAPGSSIVSACSSLVGSCSDGNSYATMSGTSMACPHVSGVTALWLSQTTAHGATFPPSAVVVKNVLQCGSVIGVINMWHTSTLNLLLQLPPSGVLNIVDATCSPDGGCSGCTGEHQHCSFGQCVCEEGWTGDSCETPVPPSWLSDSFCCSGDPLSDGASPPFNTIAFLWTDLNPSSAGSIHYGDLGGEFAIVFDEVPVYGDNSCVATIEVILEEMGSFEIIYVSNDVGSICENNAVSIGVKGPKEEESSAFRYDQRFGPASLGMPAIYQIRYISVEAPSTSPTVSTAPTHTMAPSPVPTTRPTYCPTFSPTFSPSFTPSLTQSPSAASTTQFHYQVALRPQHESRLGGNYSGLSSLVLGDDSVTALSLPFAYPFFNDTFSYVYLSSNGLMSFYYSNVFSGVNVMNKKGPNSRKDEVDGSVLNDGIFIVVLHRDLKKDNVRNVADRIRSHHSDKNAVGFHAQVQKVHDHLRMLTIRDPSDEALQFLSSHQDVASVEPNRRYSIVGNLRTELPEGPLTSNPYSWGLDRIDQENLPLDQATYNPPVDTNAGAGVDVYVADTGLDTTHAEFANTNVRSVANLYNGFGDVTENTDGHGHGTHCAGTVGGINVGVAPSANIYGLKVLSDGGSGSTSIIVEGLDMVMARRLADPTKPMVVSMSLGGGCSNCPTNPMNLAVDELSVANVTVVVAAGNSAADACVLAPASASSAVTVGSTTRDDELSSFSSVGSCVDILAPGSSIVSACSSLVGSCSDGNSYATMSGTSMACPHVSGVTALWLSQTTAHGATFPPSAVVVKNVLQCGSVIGVINMWHTSTLNLLLQLPPSGVLNIVDATCSPDGGCSGCTGEHQHCSFGQCVCEEGWTGDSCETPVPPSWLSDSFCCSGDPLSDGASPPFNTIAFLWTDLNPSSAGSIHYGDLGGEFAIVFDEVPVYGDNSCVATIEVILEEMGSFEIIYVSNDVGSICENNAVSIGVKGPKEEESSAFLFEDVFSQVRTGLPSSGTLAAVRQTGQPTSAPVAPTRLTNELNCFSDCGGGPEVTVGDTCLYVTLLDQFGDGWGDGVDFVYWLEFPNDKSDNVSSSLSCDCPLRAGCIHPSDKHESQVIHLGLQSPNDVDEVPFFWEMYWTVQVVENGVFQETYYGGIDASMSFSYSLSTQSFQSLELNDVWQPGLDMNCSAASFLGARLYDSSRPMRPFSYANETNASIAGAGYLESTWVIADMESRQQALVASSLPASCRVDVEGISSDPVCLTDGSYILRSIGKCDPSLSSFTWSFCGITDGTGLEELNFEVTGGACFITSHLNRDDYCPAPTITPTFSPSKNPTRCPSRIPTHVPTAQPSLSPTQLPSAVPTPQPSVTPTVFIPSDVTNLITKESVTETWLEGGVMYLSSSEWVSVTTTSSTFSSASVFMGSPDLLGAGGDTGFHVSARVRNVETSVDGQVSFEAKLYLANDSFCSKEWYVPEPVGTEGNIQVPWVVVEQGAYDVSGSKFMVSEGPITRTDIRAVVDANRVDFDYPVGCVSPTEPCSMGEGSTLGVVMQLQTLVYDRLLIPRAYSLGSQRSRLVLQPHDSSSASYYVMLDPETLAYIVFESGLSINCQDSSLAITSTVFARVTHATRDMSFSGVSYGSYGSLPGLYGSVTTSRRLGDSTSVRVRNLTPAGATLNIQEDQCRDEEVVHTWESVSVLALGQSSVAGTVMCQMVYFPLTDSPSIRPSASPSSSPTLRPTTGPTIDPSALPTSTPTAEPTISPTVTPTLAPTQGPSKVPTIPPTSIPSHNPTPVPTALPSLSPTPLPSAVPTPQPSVTPTIFIPSDVTNLITKESVTETWLEGGVMYLSSSEWVSVTTTSSSFSSASVFMGSPDLLGAGGDTGFHVSARVRNVETSVDGQVSFEAKLYLANDSFCSKEWYVPEPVGTEGNIQVPWMVVEQGAYDVSGSKFMVSEGPITRTDIRAVVDANRVDFDYPVGCVSPTEPCSMGEGSTLGVVMQLQTLVYDRLLIPRAYSLGSQRSRLVLQPHDSSSASYYVMLDPETLAYIVFESGLSINCQDSSLAITSTVFARVTHATRDMSFTGVSYGSYGSLPGLYGSVTSSRRLGDSTSVRVRNLTPAGATLNIQEDQCRDEEVVHTWESVSVLALGQSSVAGTVMCQMVYFPLTDSPSIRPSASPSSSPTLRPTTGPTIDPSALPTSTPTAEPTISPTVTPTLAPTQGPSKVPTIPPTSIPSHNPTPVPTALPSLSPTPLPSAVPTPQPSVTPTIFIPSDVTNLITKESVTETWLEGSVMYLSSSEWVSVTTTSSTFSSASVFMGSPDLLGAGGDTGFHVSARVRNVETSVDGQVSFEAKLYLANDSFCSKEWYVPEPVGTEGNIQVPWVVVEQGAYDVSGSKFMVSEGPITRTDIRAVVDANRVDFDYPVGCVSPTEPCSMGEGSTLGVVMQLQTLVYDRLLIPRAYSLGSQRSRLVLQPHDSSSASYYVMLDPETLAYIVFESGLSINCQDSSLAITSTVFARVTHATRDMSFSGVSYGSYGSLPGLYGSVTTSRRLGDSTSVRVRNLTPAGATLNIQEDQCRDEEVVHTWESVSVLALGQSSVAGTVMCQMVYFPLTDSPSIRPSASPSSSPTLRPTTGPTIDPSALPTSTPTAEPTISPTVTPTLAPTQGPSKVPTIPPTSIPSHNPTPVPTALPSLSPTPLPSAVPTPQPSVTPTIFIPSDVTNLITKESVTETWLEGSVMYLSSSEWVSVTTTSSTFSSASVFMGSPDLLGAGGDTGFHVSARVRNVETSVDGQVSFEAKLYLANDSFCSKEWYVPEPVGTEGNIQVPWVVVEQGAYDVSGSKFMVSEGPITRTDIRAVVDANRVDFDYPVGCVSPTEPCSMGEGGTLGVVMQLQTLVYDRLLIPRAYSLGSQRSRLVLQPHDSSSASYYVMLDPETLAYIVFESGLSINCQDSSLAITSTVFARVTHATRDMSFTGVSYGSYGSLPGLYGSVTSSRRLGDSTSVRVRNLTPAGATLNIQEDQCRDEEVVHTWESVSVLALGQSSVAGTVMCQVVYFPLTDSPSIRPTASPVQQLNELNCISDCGGPEFTAGDTCLYVTLLDQFGDGWGDGVDFVYWLEFPNDKSDNVSSTLSCDCPLRAGCIHPSDKHESQVIHLGLQSPNDVDEVPFFWEMYWTVQVVENGVFQETYYGGIDASMSFSYSLSTQSFQSLALNDVWQPGLDMNCSAASFLGARLYDSSGPMRPFSYANETNASIAGAGYLESTWVITDLETQQTLLGSSLPVSCHVDAEGNKSDPVCLTDGSYVLRSIGRCDPSLSSFTWSFCGIANGKSLEELHFDILNGACTVVNHSSLEEIC